MNSKNIINTLRHGTPPPFEANWSTFGRTEELNAFDETLELIENGASSVKLMLGDFGVGKSALIEQLKARALSKDFVIASFQIQDGFRFNKIDDLYYAIMHNLSVKHKPDGKSSFNDLFEIWLNNLQNSPFPDRNRLEINTVCQALSQYNMNYARAFLAFMRARIQRNPEMQNVTTAWLTGERQIPYELKQKYGLTGFVDKTNTIDFLKAFSKLLTLLDYKGLIVFIDELDLIMSYRTDLRMNALQNLKQLIDLTDLEHTLFFFSGTMSLWTDEEKGIASLPSLAQRLNYSVDETLSTAVKRQPVTRLEPIPPETLKQIGLAIKSLYFEAYPEKSKPDSGDFSRTMDEIITQSTVTRHFVTKLVQYLDT